MRRRMEMKTESDERSDRFRRLEAKATPLSTVHNIPQKKFFDKHYSILSVSHPPPESRPLFPKQALFHHFHHFKSYLAQLDEKRNKIKNEKKEQNALRMNENMMKGRISKHIMKGSLLKHKRHKSQPNLVELDEMDPFVNYQDPKKLDLKNMKYLKFCSMIDAIYHRIQCLKNLGYTSTKVSQWFINFSSNKSPFLQEIMLMSKKPIKSLAKPRFVLQKNKYIAKDKIKEKLNNGNDTFDDINSQQIREVCDFFDEILIQKSMKRAREIQKSIVEKIPFVQRKMMKKNREFVFTRKEPSEICHFLIDLQTYEDKYGEFLSLAKVNKLRFQELNRVEKHLQQKYQEGINFGQTPSLLEGAVLQTEA